MTTTNEQPKWMNNAYWGITILLAVAMVGGGFGDLTGADFTVESFVKLGYPLYLGTILGTGKLLGAIAIVVPGFLRLKEWAYAGFSFNMLGAIASHALSGDPVTEMIAPAVLWLIVMASYYLHTQRTTMGAK